MESLKTIASLLVYFSLCLELAAGIATSHQSIVSGEGWGYKFGIVHGPHGIGHAVGESYPHGYGGFGTYAPSYGYEDYSSGHHHVPVAAVHSPPAVHIPLPAVHAAPELIHLPDVKVLEPIKAIHPLPHAFPALKEVKSIAAPEYVLPGYLAGHHYGGDYGNGYDIGYGSDYTSGSGHHYGTGYGSGYGTGYGSGYGSGYGTGYVSGYGTGYGPHYGTVYPSEYNHGDLLSHNYHDHNIHYFKGFPSYDDVLLSSHGLYGDYSGEHYKTTYNKPYYNDYYGSSSYHH